MSDPTPPPAASEHDTNLAAARAAIQGFDGPTRAGLRETLVAWGDGPAQHALQLLRPNTEYTATSPGWNARVQAITELADAEGRPPKPDTHFSADAKEQHPMNIHDGSTWYEGLRRDVYDAHRDRATADLATIEEQGSLDQMLGVMDHGPFGVEHRLGQMRPPYDVQGSLYNGGLSPEAVEGRRQASKDWINDPATQAKHAEWSEFVRANTPAQQRSPLTVSFQDEIFEAGRRSMELDLSKLTEPQKDRLAWQVRTFDVSHGEHGLRSPDIPPENYGRAGIEGRESALRDWFTVNQVRGTEWQGTEHASEQDAAQRGDADQAMHAAMAGRPQAQVVATEAAPAEKADGAATAERPAHLAAPTQTRRDGQGVGG